MDGQRIDRVLITQKSRGKMSCARVSRPRTGLDRRSQNLRSTTFA